MKNIILVGLVYDKNLGDMAIYECCQNTIQKILAENGENIELRLLDLYGRNRLKSTRIRRKVKKMFKKINKLFRYSERRSDIICECVMSEYDRIVDNQTAAIIFVGGGLIKFSHQIIAEPMCAILEKANKQNIPVMLSAVGVEGYDQNLFECLRLKKALNYDVVKTITTRDDLITLKEKYITNTKIKIDKVADPACLISELYCSKKKECLKKKRIGFGIGRFNIFHDYGSDIEENEIINFWKRLYDRFTSIGYECILFTNGLPADYEASQRIKKYLNLPDNQVMERPQNVDELTNIISSLDAAVVTRLHSSIIAYSYEIPTIGLVWNNKQIMFGENIGHGERFVQWPFDVDKIEEILEKALFERETINRDYCQSTNKELEAFLLAYVL